MKQSFGLPQTEKCKVQYIKNDVVYSTIIATPRDNEGLFAVMRDTRQIGSSQIQRVDPLIPTSIEMNRPHPAHHRINQFANVA